MSDKNSQQSWNRRELPQADKGHLLNHITNIILNSETLDAFPSTTGTRQECSPWLLRFSVVLEGLSRAAGQLNEKMCIPIGKEEIEIISTQR